MKKWICTILALMLILAGCQAGGGATTSAPVTTQAPTEATEEAAQESTFPTLAESGMAIGGPVLGGPQGDQLAFENVGKARIQYQGNRSYVRYVTSVEELPPECTWEGYDEAYVQTKALLIVVETLNSGSVQVELESIQVKGDVASVSIRRTMTGDVGTTDMATWIFWAEVEKGLSYTWTLANASQLPAGEKY